MQMMIDIQPPDARECELCGRKEVWKDGAWRVSDEQPGEIYCIHEWNITGDYSPVNANS